MRPNFIVALIAASSVVTLALAADPAQPQPAYKSAAELKAELVRPKAGVGGGMTPLAVGHPGQLDQFIRTEPSAYELHTNLEHLFIATGGEATMIIGGVLEDQKPAPNDPNSRNGTKITGGRTVVVKAGDIVFIPANTPHYTVPKGEISFISINRK